MAERRMFAKAIIDSDAFVDMPMSARLLYYDLGMRADDDGFVNSPRKIMKMIGASDDDAKILISKKFVIPFESGIIVIKHWRVNNYIRNDRYNKTKHILEMSKLIIEDNGSYKLENTPMLPSGIPSDSQVVDSRDTEVRLGKVRLGKVSADGNQNENGLAKKGLYEFWGEQVIDAFDEKYPDDKLDGKKADAKFEYCYANIIKKQVDKPKPYLLVVIGKCLSEFRVGYE
jgi:hypothetical protein